MAKDYGAVKGKTQGHKKKKEKWKSASALGWWSRVTCPLQLPLIGSGNCGASLHVLANVIISLLNVASLNSTCAQSSSICYTFMNEEDNS
jgi:hypothetical protein